MHSPLYHVTLPILQLFKSTSITHMDFRQFPENFRSVDRLQPALTVGLPVFTFVLVLIDFVTGNAVSNAFALYAGAIFKLELNRISMYPLAHTGIFHWFVNVISLSPLLARFEKVHGTVYTGITLNLLAVSTALIYSLLAGIISPSTRVEGLSAICFLFLEFYALKEQSYYPIAFQWGDRYRLPTKYSAFVVLIITFILVPNSSLLGHLAGIGSGYLLAENYLKILYPPRKVILFIEDKLELLIAKLLPIVVYYREDLAADTRTVAYVPLFGSDAEASSARFESSGHVLCTS